MSKVPIIADGGITEQGDIAKSIVCGATMCMAGRLFSGYDQSSGEVIIIDDKRYKSFWIVKRRFLWVKKVAYIDNVNRGDYDLGLYDKLEFSRNIEVYDKEFYDIFKKFGKKHNFCCIKKCWDGAEREYIKEYLKEMKK